jgi:hypothetical protein
MKMLLKLISFTGLVIMLVSSIMVFNDAMTKDTYLVQSLIGTVMWFATVPFWMKRRLHHSE